jgi:hypothetical protein
LLSHGLHWWLAVLQWRFQAPKAQLHGKLQAGKRTFKSLKYA